MKIFKQIKIGLALAIVFTTGGRQGWLMFGIQAACAIALFTIVFLETRHEFANNEIGHGGRQFKNIAAAFGFAFCMALLCYHHFWRTY